MCRLISVLLFESRKSLYSGLLYKLHDVGVRGTVFDVTAGFLSGRVQRVAVDGICSENVRVVSGVPQGSVIGPLLFFGVH